MSASATARKLPRVDLRKFLAGGVAGRREAVALVGDALREEGAVRVEGHGATDADGLVEVGVHLLAALADYFGLAPNAFGVGVASPAEGWSPEPDVLLVVLAGVPPGAELRPAGADEWRPITAHPGEIAAVPGAALAVLTGGVVPAAMVRWPEGATHAVALSAAPGATLSALPEFR